MLTRWLIVLMCSMILMACHTKKVATRETYNLHAMDALQWDEQDTFTIIGRPSWFPYLEPCSSMVGSVRGDSVTTIIRHRKGSATNQHERSDTANTTKLSDSRLSLNPETVLPPFLTWVIYLIAFLVITGFSIALVVRLIR